MVFVGVLVTVNVQAQSAIAKELKADINRSAGMFYARPVVNMPKDTPAPLKVRSPSILTTMVVQAPIILTSRSITRRHTPSLLRLTVSGNSQR